MFLCIDCPSLFKSARPARILQPSAPPNFTLATRMRTHYSRHAAIENGKSNLHMPSALSIRLCAVGDTLAGDSPPPLSPTTPPADPEWLLVLMAMGVIAGIIWLIRRLTYPEKFKLGRTPGRKNRLDPLLLLAAVMLIYMLY